MMKEPLLYLSEFIEEHRGEYYRLLLKVSQKGSWKEWLEFFLRGVALQSKRATEQALQLVKLNQLYRKQLGTKRVPTAALQLIDHIFLNPLILPSQLASQWGLSFPTLMKGVNKLVDIGTLEETTHKQRNRLYRASEVVALLTKGT